MEIGLLIIPSWARINRFSAATIRATTLLSRVGYIFYVPPAQKIVFPLQLRVTECYLLRYRGI